MSKRPVVTPLPEKPTPPKDPGAVTYGLRPPKKQKDEAKDGD
jgi:hypothetical protein